MSIVYKAQQTAPVQRDVAIKVIRPSMSNPTAVKRFFREQHAAAMLKHPNIATLYGVDKTPDGQPFAVLEYVDGLPINAFCDKYQLTWKQRVDVFLKTCKGLSHAHQHGIVHRDIKPENILVKMEDRRPAPKLIDFGVAKIQGSVLKNNMTLTHTGYLVGSPRYMSPEQFDDSHSVDQRSDIYSAAMVLFELLARVPFRAGETVDQLIVHTRSDEPDRLSERIKKNASEDTNARYDADWPERLIRFARRDLDWVLGKALAKNPEDRYPDVPSFLNELRAAINGEPVSVSAPNFLTRTKRWAKSNAKILLAACLTVSVLTTCLCLYITRNSNEDLTHARIVNSEQVQQTADANELIMKLLSSETYELTTDQFNVDLIPSYRARHRQIQLSGGPKSREDKFVYGILAVMEAMAGDFDQADRLMEAADTEHSGTELRSVRAKICEEYANIAKEKLEHLDLKSGSFEKASQQMTLGRCYVVWGMLDDAEELLKKAIRFLESNHAGSYESLVAHLTLARIYQKSNQPDLMEKQLVKTQQRFSVQNRLLKTERGQRAFARVISLLVAIAPDKYESLGQAGVRKLPRK